MTFPHNIPLPIRKTEKERKISLMDTLLAPMAFNTPIMFVRSNMIMSNPDIMVKPATPVIKIRITQTFVSSNPSQSKI